MVDISFVDRVANNSYVYGHGTSIFWFCIVTDNVLRLREFYRTALNAESDGDESHSFVHLADSSLAIYSPKRHKNPSVAAQHSGAGSIIL
jgi:hypothetical protein